MSHSDYKKTTYMYQNKPVLKLFDGYMDGYYVCGENKYYTNVTNHEKDFVFQSEEDRKNFISYDTNPFDVLNGLVELGKSLDNKK